ncbi:MAG: FKBP-type peptidyl-prolyl cis-trans isomerase [Novosphingobium sp.]|uniref:FKBP-type peptidyl-prolyl cis-trans isomerase n=1 Tax=Novosphingobium sp. TaxID=1874826 RepID=UPI0032B7DF07
MTEITRVPLQPIAKGALGKLWLGVAAAALAAGGLAWATLPAGVKVEVIKAGEGASPTVDDITLINYKGSLADGGTEFDKGEKAVMPVEGSIPGFQKALQQMQRGGKYKIFIPAELAYGNKAQGPIPANSDLNFEVELLDFKSRAEIEQQQRMMQQMQQMQAQQGGGAGPGGAAPPPNPSAPQPQ